MPPERPHLSITLPRNFQFHYTDGQLPKTPEPRDNRETTVEPPKLPRQTYRLRRRRAPLPSYDINLDPEDVPIPSIETTAAPAGSSNVVNNEPVEGYLQPEPVSARFRTPRTPVAQMAPRRNSNDNVNDWADHDAMSAGEISRPSSACSGFSDSSSYSNLSYGGSCTSPESECNDPFTMSKSQALISPFSIVNFSSDAPRGMKRKAPRPVFTEDMDRHLWICYMQYLQDPTVTPFKMLPGVAPPLGVCVRVARLARKSWKGPRFSTQPRGTKRSFGSPATVKPLKSGSTTPTNNTSKSYLSWPRENAPTRKRLRELIKRKPTLSAHYARLVNCRTPSPFPSSPQQAPQQTSHGMMSSLAQNSSFSTREMNISLATSTSSTMQFGNPLMNMAQERSSNKSTNTSTDEWFGQPMTRPVQHQKSQSLHFARAGPTANGALRSLRSPFHERPQYPSTRSRSPYGPRDDIHAPLPLPRSFKRRALYHLDDSEIATPNPIYRESLLQELFGAPAETSHRRIRSRGFSLGDMGDGVRGLSAMFTPPQAEPVEPVQPVVSQTPPQTTQQPPQTHLASAFQPTTRLGSPFGGRSSNVYFNNTFPRNFTPHSFEPSVSFEERLGDMN